MPKIQLDKADDYYEHVIHTDKGLASFSIMGDDIEMVITVGEKGGKKTSVRLNHHEAYEFFKLNSTLVERFNRNLSNPANRGKLAQ